MEKSSLTSQESMAIIAEMIRRSKTNRFIGDGNLLLMWGYVTIAVTALVWGTLAVTHSPAANWLWFLIWIIGGTATPVMARKQRQRQGVTTYTDTICNSIWTIVGASCIALTVLCLAFLLAGKDSWSAFLMLPFLIVGFAEAVQGIVIRERSLIWGGAVGILAGLFILCCIAGNVTLRASWFMPMLMGTFAIMMVLPGHILNSKSRKQS